MRHSNEQLKHLEIMNESISEEILNYLENKVGKVLKADKEEYLSVVLEQVRESIGYFLASKLFGLTDKRIMSYTTTKLEEFFAFIIKDGKRKTIITLKEHLEDAE